MIPEYNTYAQFNLRCNLLNRAIAVYILLCATPFRRYSFYLIFYQCQLGLLVVEKFRAGNMFPLPHYLQISLPYGLKLTLAICIDLKVIQ